MLIRISYLSNVLFLPCQVFSRMSLGAFMLMNISNIVISIPIIHGQMYSVYYNANNRNLHGHHVCITKEWLIEINNLLSSL